MALQNIGAGNRDDAFYRYKMPKMITKIEGRGNGIKTNIVNMLEIAKALARPASYTTKYFGCELGAQSKFDEKSGTSHVNGAHDTAKLAALLENFIKKYVQCYGCGNPETEIVITKTQLLALKCAACGFVSDVDMRDKLTTFILKNPPEAKKSSKDKKAMRRAEKERLKEGAAADEEMKKLKRDAAKKKSSKDGTSKVVSSKKKSQSDEDHSPPGSQVDETEPAVVEEGDDDVEWQTDTSFEAAQKRMQEQLTAATTELVMLTTDEEKLSDEKTPKSEQTVEAIAHSNGKKPADPKDMLVNELKEFLEKGSSAGELKSHLVSLSGTAQDITDALMEVLFDGVGKGFSKEVAKKKNYLAAAVAAYGEESPLVLLNAIEAFCVNSRPDAVKEVALVLKVLYDVELIVEDSIMNWFEKGCVGDNKSSAMWKNIKPFIEWLQSAESESDEE